MSKIRAIGDKVLIRRVDADEKTPGGIIIPENAKKKPTEGIVVSVGPGKATASGFVETTVKEGDRVIFPMWREEIEYDGERLVIIPEEHILAVYDEPPDWFKRNPPVDPDGNPVEWS